jgi:hypothetical protein
MQITVQIPTRFAVNTTDDTSVFQLAESLVSPADIGYTRREGSEVATYEVNHTSELEFHVLVIVGVCGNSNAVVHIFLGGRVIHYFGPRCVFTATFWALMFVFSAYPLLTFLARRLGVFFELIHMPVQRLAESEDYAV